MICGICGKKSFAVSYCCNGELYQTEDNEKIIPESIRSLRDYFAAKAMCGLLSDCRLRDTAENISKYAYKLADEMLKAREYKKGGK